MAKTARAETQPLSIEDEITQAAIERLEQGADGRLREIMVSLTRHLHGFIRDIEPTEEEWLAAFSIFLKKLFLLLCRRIWVARKVSRTG